MKRRKGRESGRTEIDRQKLASKKKKELKVVKIRGKERRK